MRSSVTFVLDGKVITEDFSRLSPTTTVLNYLRASPSHKGVKEGCAEGDCGACTVVLCERDNSGVLHYKSVDSCLMFLPMLHGKQLVTVENLTAYDGSLHPVQQAMVETGGSQCGFCTPGIVMSMFSLYKSHRKPDRALIDDALTGNLCRCTGYRPIVEAAAQACVHDSNDHFSAGEQDINRLLASIQHHSGLLSNGRQTYHQPATLLEALTLVHQYPAAFVICGATDVALRVTKKHEVLSTVIDLSLVHELQSIRTEQNELRIGACATLTTLEPMVREDFPALAAMLSVFGSRQIRNLATLGGNLGSASPIGDSISALIPHGARVVLQSVSGKREVPLSQFVTGYRQTVRQSDELIVEIIVPKLSQATTVRWYKVSKRKDLDISTVSAGFRLEVDGQSTVKAVTMAYGGMAERVRCAESAERFLLGKKWSRENVEAAMAEMGNDFTPISDARGSAEFRKVAARNLLLRFWNDTHSRINGSGSR